MPVFSFENSSRSCRCCPHETAVYDSCTIESLLALPRLSIEGLMTIPPLAEEAEPSRKFFAQLRELRENLEKEFDVKLPQLSMGMTNDFPVAIEEGATLVRVGTAIFGERKRAKPPKSTTDYAD